MDTHGRGYITVDKFRQHVLALKTGGAHTQKAGSLETGIPHPGLMLPGISDEAVNAKAAELLIRKADVDGDGKVSLGEYLRMIEAFHNTRYRHDFVSDVVFSLFDVNSDGNIDRADLRKLAAVLVEAHHVDVYVELFMRADVNKDGVLSKLEMREAFRMLKAGAQLR